MDHLAEIRSRLNITELLSSYLELKRAGRNFKSLCPFHAEKTPSFIISPERDFAWCFGCQKGGDIFKMVELLEGVDFKEAVKILAEKTGVTLPANFSSGTPKEQKARLKEIQEIAADFFSQQLTQNPAAQTYLSERGLKPATLRTWQLGYAPQESNELIEQLEQKKFTAKEIVTAGIASLREFGGEKLSAKFFNRLIFPIANLRGEIVAFTGRIFGAGEPKYLNSCESPIFVKGEILFGLPQAREAILQKKCVIVMEGQMDVLLAHQAQFKNVVATSGTALTEKHFQKLAKLTDNLILSLDGDTAGKAATIRALALAAKADLNPKIAIWPPEFKDPAEVIQKDPELFQTALDTALSPLDFFLTKVFQPAELTETATRKKVVRELLTYAQNFRSAVEREDFLKKISLRLKIEPRTLCEEGALLPQFHSPRTAQLADPQLTTEDLLLALALTFPAIGVPKIQTAQIEFQRKINQELWSELTQNSEPKSEAAEKLRLLALEKYADFEDDQIGTELTQILQKLSREKLQARKKTLRQKIAESEESGDPETAAKLLAEYAELSA